MPSTNKKPATTAAASKPKATVQPKVAKAMGTKPTAAKPAVSKTAAAAPKAKAKGK